MLLSSLHLVLDLLHLDFSLLVRGFAAFDQLLFVLSLKCLDRLGLVVVDLSRFPDLLCVLEVRTGEFVPQCFAVLAFRLCTGTLGAKDRGLVFSAGFAAFLRQFEL